MYIIYTITNYTVVSWTEGLKDIGRTINNVARKPKCRQAHQRVVDEHVRSGVKIKDKGMLTNIEELTVSVSGEAGEC